MLKDKERKLPEQVSPDEAESWRENTLKSLKWYSKDGWEPGYADVSAGFYGCVGKFLCCNCGGYSVFTIVCPEYIKEFWEGEGYQVYCNHCGRKHRIYSTGVDVVGKVDKVWTWQAEPVGDLQQGLRSELDYGRGSEAHERAKADNQETGDSLPPAGW